MFFLMCKHLSLRDMQIKTPHDGNRKRIHQKRLQLHGNKKTKTATRN